jgi:GPH family glycoside/pentoside/hexuronide:cation symporter
MTKAAPNAPLSLGRTLTFSATGLPVSALVVALTVHLPPYFAASLGVPLAAVGAVFGLCRLIDIPIEPMLGLAMDRTRTRWGRFRFWMLIGAPLMLLGLVMLTNARQGVGEVYLIGWLLVMYLGLSILLLSHTAWAATLATTYASRARIFGIIGGVGVMGALGVLVIPVLMEGNGYTDAEGVRGMIWFVIALIPVCVGLVVWRTPETVAPEDPGQQFRLRDYLDLVTHASMARILVADLCLALGPGWMAAMFLFFMRDRMGFTTGEANLLLGVYIVAGLFGAPATGWVATRLGKHRTAMLSSAIYCAALISMLWLPHGDLGPSALAYFASGFVAAGFTALIRAMVADVADDIRLTQGKERGGLLYSLIASTNKVAVAASVIITYPLLAQIGYDPSLGHGNSAAAIQGLTWAFLAGPIAFLALGAISMIGYRLTAERATETRRQLEERDAALLAATPPGMA